MDDDIIPLHQSFSDEERESYATKSENDTYSSETTDAGIDTEEIEAALNMLTDSGSHVNIYEVDLQQAIKERELFKKESKQRQKELEDSLHPHIVKAKPFVELCRKVKEKQDELAQSAATVYKAKMEYIKAKYMYFPHSDGKKKSETWSGAAWQEMRRQATERIRLAKILYSDKKSAHAVLCAKFEEALKENQAMKKKLKTSIQKSRPYFVERYEYHHRLKEFDKRIDFLQKRVREQRAVYNNSLKRLETLSDMIHEAKKRGNKSCDDVSKMKEPIATAGNTDSNLLQVSPNKALQRRASEPIYTHQSHSDREDRPPVLLPMRVVTQDTDVPPVAEELIIPPVDKTSTQPVTRRAARHMLEESTCSEENDLD